MKLRWYDDYGYANFGPPVQYGHVKSLKWTVVSRVLCDGEHNRLAVVNRVDRDWVVTMLKNGETTERMKFPKLKEAKAWAKVTAAFA